MQEIHVNEFEYFRNSDGFLEVGGIVYEDDGEFAVEEVFEWCGCGSPQDAAETILNSLRHVQARSDIVMSDEGSRETRWEKVQELDAQFNPDKGTREIIYYVLAKANLTEHGGSVPGWLSRRGRDVLELLQKWHDEA